MDRKIEKGIKNLREVAKCLKDDGDLDAVDYSETIGYLDKLDTMLLKHDTVYDAKRMGKKKVMV